MAITIDLPSIISEPIAFGPDQVQLGDTYIDLPLIDRQATAFGPYVDRETVAVADGEPQPHDISVELWDETNTTQLVAEVPAVVGSRSFQDDPLSIGLAELKVLSGTDAEETAADAYTEGRVLRYRVDGEPAFPARILTRDDVEVAKDHGDEQLTVKAADMRSLLRGCKIRPRAGYRDLRSFNWAAPELDVSSWANAIVQQAVTSFSWRVPNTDPPWFQPWLPPVGWVDIATPVIASRYTKTYGASRFLARRTFTVASSGLYQIILAAWSGFELWVDGEKRAASAPEPAEAWTKAHSCTLYLDAGEHTFGLLVHKWDLPNLLGRVPGTIATVNREHCAVFELHYLADGLDTVTGSSTIVMRSDANWRRLDNPTTLPSPSFGVVARTLVEEGQTRESLPAELALGFSDEFDSAGNPWPTDTAWPAFRSSDDVWAFIEVAHDLGYRTRFRWDGLTLDAWGPGSAGEDTVTLTATDVLGRLEREQRQLQPNTLRVVWSDGDFILVDTAAKTAAGRAIEEELQLADVRDEDSARIIGQAHLDRFALSDRSVQVATLLTPQASALAPYRAYRPLDRVTLPGAETAEVARLTVREDSSGVAVVVPDLHTRPESDQRRISAAIDRGIPGTMAGRSSTATPSRWADDGLNGQIRPYSLTEWNQVTAWATDNPDPDLAEKAVSSPHTFDVPVRLTWVNVTAVVPPVTDDLLIEMRRNGVRIATIGLGVGEFNTVWFATQWVFQVNDKLDFATVQSPLDGDDQPETKLLQVRVIAARAQASEVQPLGRLLWT